MIVFLRWLFLVPGIVILASALFLWIVSMFLIDMLPPILGLRMASVAPLVLVGLALLVPGLLLCLVPTRRRQPVLSAGRGRAGGRPRPPVGGGRSPRGRLDRL
ncbi:hypothetical protein P7L68_03785 (plasmid) [Tistrella mobilis]|uniref:hypothetical protein n=1 Tax=Tistrella mobilis TaxID=171437 RepID=UPI0035585A28